MGGADSSGEPAPADAADATPPDPADHPPTDAADPTPAEPTDRAPAPHSTAGRSRGELLVSLACVLAVLLGVGTIVGVHRVRTSPADPAAARFFADGARWAIARSGSGKTITVQSQVGARGVAVADALPRSMGTAVRILVASRPHAAVWTNTTTLLFPDGQHANIPEVFVASDAGIEQPIGAGTLPIPLRYEPALQVLPADPRVAAEWSQEGSSFYDALDVATYRMANRIVRADGACLVVATEVTLTPTDQGRELGASDYTDHLEVTYCPGAWATRTTADSGTTTPADRADADRARAGFTRPLITSSDASTDVETLLYERSSPFPGSADPLLVAGDNLIVDLDETSQVASGVVAGSRMVFPVWRLPGEGPVLAAPVLAGTRVVIADTHGVVTALEPRSGFVLWQRRFDRIPMRLAAAADGSAVGLIDRTGTGRLLDAATGTDLAQASVDAPVGVAVAPGPTLVLAGASGTVGVTTGGAAAYQNDTAIASGPVLLDGQVVVGTDDGRVGTLAAAGGARWTRLDDSHAVRLLAAAGGRIAAVTGERLSVLDAGLGVVAHADDDAAALTVTAPPPKGEAPPDPAATRITTTAEDGRLRVYDGSGTLLRTLQTPLRAPGSIGDATQRAAAVSLGEATWVSAVTGLVRYWTLAP